MMINEIENNIDFSWNRNKIKVIQEITGIITMITKEIKAEIQEGKEIETTTIIESWILHITFRIC